MTFLQNVYLYLAAVNVLAFALMGYDKRQARRRGSRIAEKRFFLIGLIGGSFGIGLGMSVWRHKTKHRSFTVAIPYMIAVHTLLVILATGMIGMGAAWR